MNAIEGPIWGIVLAAGAGVRFGGVKQFAEVGGYRLVDLAVRQTRRACDAVVVVLPDGMDWDGEPVARVLTGGRTRTDSVRAGLAAVPSDAGIIVVHQAANPLASPALFAAVLAAVREGADAAVPGLRPADVVRRVRGSLMVEDLGRDDLVVVQTPGAFRAEVLRAAHAPGGHAVEDTALVAASGGSVTVVDGDPRNLHVTSAAELAMVRCMLMEDAVEFAND